MGRSADNLIFSEHFDSYQSFYDNGGTLVGGTIENGKLTTTAIDQGATVPHAEGMDLILNGFVLRIKIRTDETAGTARRFFALSVDANNSITCAYQGTGVFLIQVQSGGAGSNYYVTTSSAGVSAEMREITVSWNGANAATPTLNTSIDGVFSKTDTVPASAALSTDTELGVLKMGELTGSNDFIGDIEFCDLHQGAWNAEEVLDAYEEDTYQEIDFSKFEFYLPGLTHYNDGTNDVTENIGSENNPTWGDGAGSNEPTIDRLGVKYNGTTSNIQFDNEVVGDGALTIGCLMRWEGTSEHSGNWIMTNAGATPIGMTLFYNESSDVLLFYSDDLTASSSSGAINAKGRWLSVIVTRDASGITNFYVDGKQAGTADQASGTPIAGNIDLVVGNRETLDRTFNGWINQPFLKKEVLTPRQIRNLHWTLLGNLNK